MPVRERLAFLSEAGEQIGGSLDHIQAAKTLAEVMVPLLADLVAVHLHERVAIDYELPHEVVDETTVTRRVAVAHSGEDVWDDVLPEGERLRLPRGIPVVEAMMTGRSVLIPRISAEQAERFSVQAPDRDLRLFLPGRALLVVPLASRGQVFGAVVLNRRADRPTFDETDLATAEELCRRAGLSIDNARLYRREVRVAEALQRSMLPGDAPVVAGARVCFRYLPAEQAAQVGGDWFDAIPLPGGRLGIVVGDVLGHGITSAAIMGQLRTAVRTLAAQDPRPDQLLRQLDDLTQRLGPDYFATCMYAVYDPVARRCQFSNAGHIPPVLVSSYGESTVLDVPAGVPIGVGEVAFETVEYPVGDGSRLVLCTDGLLERRRERDVEEGLAELCRVLTEASSGSLDVVCDEVVRTLSPDVPTDDVALVAVAFDGIPKDDVASWSLEAEPSMVPWIRAQTAAKLVDWGLAELVDTVELLVSELVTNALVHGAGTIGFRLIKATALLCEVSDDGHELPFLCHADATDESGRGLQLVSYLATRWGTHRTETGKVVWFEHALA